MKLLEKRIQQLEQLHRPERRRTGSVTWEEFLFLMNFQKRFPDEETAPRPARAAFNWLLNQLPLGKKCPQTDSNDSTDQ
jgi:hypothetical protein